MKNKKGQVWVETVVYTLIGLALIGLVLAIVTPKINDARDKIVVEQSIDSLINFDNKIVEVLDRPQGNRRVIDFTMRRGNLYINSTGDRIVLIIDGLRKAYSEPGVEIEFGRVKIISDKGQKSYSVSLILDYAGSANVMYKNTEEFKKFTPATTPYKFFVENKGDPTPEDGVFDLFVLNIEESSR